MTDKIDATIKLLVDEGRRKGFLTYADMSKLMEDQFLPPDRMDQVFNGLEEAGIDVIDEGDAEPEAAAKEAPAVKAKAATEVTRAAVAEKIDDPVRMYLTQMGEIPLLTRARRDLRCPRRSRSPASATATRSTWVQRHGLHRRAAIAILRRGVAQGDLAFDRTLQGQSVPQAGPRRQG